MKLLMCCLVFFSLHGPAFAFLDIVQVKSPKSNLSSWLVEDDRLPIITLQLTWRGGSATDPQGKAGLTTLLASLLNEGAGDRGSAAYQEAMSDIGLEFIAEASSDRVTATIRFMKAYISETEDLIADALMRPRFDDEAIARMKSEIEAIIAYNKQSPGKIARDAWYAQAFPQHPYGLPNEGRIEEIATIERQDLINHHAALLARKNLHIAAVGDISSRELVNFLDKILGGLPAEPSVIAPPAPPPVTAQSDTIAWSGPQTEIVFGLPGLSVSDPDFFPAFVMNYILGGGAFSSRLMQELREKRGLTYGVYTYLSDLSGAPILLGQFASQNDKALEGLDLVRDEMRKMRDTQPSDEEIEAAKTYLIGSYVLGFDSGISIASQMINVQWQGWSADYFDERTARISAVTAADISRVAQRLLTPEAMLVQIVGQPNTNIAD